jgi:hypothetical protein
MLIVSSFSHAGEIVSSPAISSIAEKAQEILWKSSGFLEVCL